jgi:hypothetical protein
MNKDAAKKVSAILTKFRKESEIKKFDFRKKILLIRIWVDILIKAEEYEMAWALDNERNSLIKLRIKERQESRTTKQRMRYYWIKLKRKFTK